MEVVWLVDPVLVEVMGQVEVAEIAVVLLLRKVTVVNRLGVVVLVKTVVVVLMVTMVAGWM